MMLWPLYALGGAAVRACCGRHLCSVELLCAPDVDVAVVHVRWELLCAPDIVVAIVRAR